MVISKSEFMMFLKHPAWLWLKKFDKEKLPIPDASLQALFDEGTLFEGYAEKLFPDAVKLGYKSDKGDFSGTKYYALPEETSQEIKKGTKFILQGRLEVDGITSTFDVLEKAGEGEFNLYEIKSSTSQKPEHIPDLAFQALVLEKSGFKVAKTAVIHVNNKYVRQGAIDPKAIAAETDVTEEVREQMPEVEAKIHDAIECLKNKQCPDLSPRYVNGGSDVLSEWLTIIQGIKGEFPKYSIYDLCTVNAQTLGMLEDNGIEMLKDISLDCELSDKQLRQVEAMRTGEQSINKDEIENFLNELKYPLYFLDYETMSGVIPAFDGYRPYQQVPFQYSLHILPEPPLRQGFEGQAGGELIHKEYLHREFTDPVPELLEHLHNDFDKEGTVISWYMSFEKSRNSEMAKQVPKYEKFLLGVNDRMVDLMTPFSKGWFVDKDFFGSASIKYVLPALLPELSYKELAISNGAQAQQIWMQTVLKGKNPEKKDQIMKDLIKYCGLDTYAMYAIFKYLTSRVSQS